MQRIGNGEIENVEIDNAEIRTLASEEIGYRTRPLYHTALGTMLDF